MNQKSGTWKDAAYKLVKVNRAGFAGGSNS